MKRLCMPGMWVELKRSQSSITTFITLFLFFVVKRRNGSLLIVRKLCHCLHLMHTYILNILGGIISRVNLYIFRYLKCNYVMYNGKPLN